MLSYFFSSPPHDFFNKKFQSHSRTIRQENFAKTGVNRDSSAQKKINIIGNTSQCLQAVHALGDMPSYFDISIFNLGVFNNTSSNFKVQALMEVLEDPNYINIILSEIPLFHECYKSFVNQNMPIKPAFISNSTNDIVIPCDDIDSGISDYAAIGIQKHMSDPLVFNQFEEKSYNFIRLGQLRSNFQVCEVVLRQVNYMHLNLNVIKSSELPFNLGSSPCGLTIEEACQLGKYIGLTPDIKVLNIDGINQDAPESYYEKVATMLWYIIEAISMRDELDQSAHVGDVNEYVISLDNIDQPLRFLINENERRWWLRLPSGDEDEKLYPCSESDYIQAKNNIISDRLLKIMESVD